VAQASEVFEVGVVGSEGFDDDGCGGFVGATAIDGCAPSLVECFYYFVAGYGHLHGLKPLFFGDFLGQGRSGIARQYPFAKGFLLRESGDLPGT